MVSGEASERSAQAVAPEVLLELVGEIAAEMYPERKRSKAVTLDTSLERDLGLDSLGRVELLTRLEKTFELSLPEQTLAAAETPRDLLRALASAGPAGLAEAAEALSVEPLGDAEAAPDSTRTLVEALEWHVERHPDRVHVSYRPPDGPAEELTYGGLLERGKAVAAGLQARGLEPGQAAGIMLPTGLDYFASFYGIQLAGGTPVPLYPPARPSQIEDHLRRQAGILRTSLSRFLVTFDQVRPLARLVKPQVPSLQEVVTVEELEGSAGDAPLPAVRGRDIAFLQFTSGSTGDPKGVVLTHRNLLANLRVIGDTLELGPHDTVVSWLPLYHDMGLIGAWMGSLYHAMPLVLLSPLTFLSRPDRWLRELHRNRGTTSAAPNFAYELCLKKVEEERLEGLDLSSWRLALNGAEKVSPETLRRFSERFAKYGFREESFLPVYGLAECSLALAFPPHGRGPKVDVIEREPFQRSGRATPVAEGEEGGLEFVACGFPLAGHEVRVVDAAGSELGERQEGSLHFRGPSATSGYYRNPEATARLFHGEWLDSGDLGYLADGEVYVTGRAKDVIIRAGRNIYPEEVEEAVGGLPGIRKGCIAVFGVADEESGTERMVVMAEVRDPEAEQEELRQAIQELVLELTGAPPDEVVLAPPQTVLKTSSGKIRRAASREVYERGGGRGAKAVYWQVARLAWAGFVPQLKRQLRRLGDLAYASWFWLAVGCATPLAVLLVVALPGRSLRRRAARLAARAVAALLRVPVEVTGLESLGGLGPSVLAPNHQSYLDGFLLTAVLPTDVAFVVKGELRSNPVAWIILKRVGAVFVERFDAGKGVEDSRYSLDVLERGESVAIFPEGTFKRAPGLLPFRMGAFAIAAEAGRPIVPVVIRGTRNVLRGEQWLPRRGRVKVRICAAVEPAGSSWADAVELRDRVRAEILRHLGEPDLAP